VLRKEDKEPGSERKKHPKRAFPKGKEKERERKSARVATVGESR
jgi:hypothetical protein|tara:strand:+ start:253 stop:384 length:132 start_codon:yes stop_codon:yes gene_type:complete